VFQRRGGSGHEPNERHDFVPFEETRMGTAMFDGKLPIAPMASQLMTASVTAKDRHCALSRRLRSDPVHWQAEDPSET
jgi:hypothetical protein